MRMMIEPEIIESESGSHDASDAAGLARQDAEANGDEHSGEEAQAESDDHDSDDAEHADEGHVNSDNDHGDDESHGEDGHGEGGHGDGGHGDGHGDGHAHDYLDQDTLLHHVGDAEYFEYSGWITGSKGVKHLDIPQPTKTEQPVFGSESSPIKPFDLSITKFMLIEVMVAIALMVVFVPLAQRIKRGGAPKGRFWNFFEVLLLFVRDQVARPSIGKEDADKYVPYLWTTFFFILFCNLFGLIPFLGSPTGALGCTAVLAIGSALLVFGTGFAKFGFVGFMKAQVPHMDLPLAFAIIIKPMIFLIEFIGLFMKHIVLALRLFANMFAGHLVLAVLLAFIGATWGSTLVYFVTPATLFASVGVYLLEIFVAFLQAYIFVFLTSLFIGAAAHPH